ncbi:MAG: hypothetical protein AB7K71_16115 [Polyangiaceae bacterium]
MSGNLAERGSILEWRWTPFFALLTLALVVSLITALVVPSTPAQLFGAPEMTKLSRQSGIPTQSGLGSTLSPGESGNSDDEVGATGSGSSRRGSLQRLAERNRGVSSRPAPPPQRFAEPVRRDIPPPPEPELSADRNANDHSDPEEAPVQDQADEPEEDEPEQPAQAGGSAGAGPDSEGEQDEEGPPAPLERPKLLNPGVLRTLPGLQR